MIGVELLDDPRADPALVRRALADIARTNRLFGGTHAVIATLERHFRAAPQRPWTLLDIGTGQGDIPLAAAKAARRHGIDLRLVGVERIPAAARIAREQGLAAVLADGGSLPFAPKSVDVVIASQVLHHFPRDTAARWIAAFDVINEPEGSAVLPPLPFNSLSKTSCLLRAMFRCRLKRMPTTQVRKRLEASKLSSRRQAMISAS